MYLLYVFHYFLYHYIKITLVEEEGMEGHWKLYVFIIDPLNVNICHKAAI